MPPVVSTAQLDNLSLPRNTAVGIVAGWGSFPIEVARGCWERGNHVFVAAIKDHAAAELSQFATDMKWFGVAKLGHQIRFFERRGVKHVTLAGKLFKDRILFHGRGWIQHLPDVTCIQALYPSFVTRSRDTRDDTLLTAIVNAFLRKDICVVPATTLAPQLIARAGCLTARSPTRRERLDIEFGWQIARQMGGLDIGQSITVRDQSVLAVEAIEGTDAMIQRTAQLCPRGGFTLVKVAKPDQDMRFDVPTIGLRTLENLKRAGGSAIAIEADRSILVDRQQALDFANRHGIAIMVLSQADSTNKLNQHSNEAAAPELRIA